MLGKMKLEDLQKLYLNELKDAYDFEHRILEALPKMESQAHSESVKAAFREHHKVTEGQIRRLEKVFESLGEKPSRHTCEGIKGIIKEGEEFVKAKGDPATIDASLISAAQRVEHYEMAAYGTLRTYARVLGHNDQESLLQETLNEEGNTDHKLTQLAQSGINIQAAR
jgi:ferritin-like metal-binding protein YciE